MCPSLGLKSDSFHYSRKYVFFFFFLIAAISSLEMTDMWNLLRSHFSLLTTKTFLTGFSKNGREWVLPFPFHSNTGQSLDWKPLRWLSLIPKGGAVVRVDKLQNPPLPESLWHCFLKPPYHHDLGCNSSNSLTPGLLKQLPSWLFRLRPPVHSVSMEQGDHPPKLPSPVTLFLDLPQLALANHTHLMYLWSYAPWSGSSIQTQILLQSIQTFSWFTDTSCFVQPPNPLLSKFPLLSNFPSWNMVHVPHIFQAQVTDFSTTNKYLLNFSPQNTKQV